MLTTTTAIWMQLHKTRVSIFDFHPLNFIYKLSTKKIKRAVATRRNGSNISNRTREEGTIMNNCKTILTRRFRIKINIRIIRFKSSTISRSSNRPSMLYRLSSLMNSQIASYSQCLTLKCKVLSILETQRPLEEQWAGKLIKVCLYS